MTHTWYVPSCASWEALTNIDGIIAKSQALMVARGDLGVELGLNRVPLRAEAADRTCQASGALCAWACLEGVPERA